MTDDDVSDQRPVEGRPSEDAELVARARDGDVGAFEELVTRYQDIAFRVAWLVVRDRGDAEDAVQDAFVKAYYALPRFRPGAPFRPWILRIVANEARNRGRSARRRDGLALRVAATDAADAAPSPEAAVLERADAEALVAALERLPERDRLVRRLPVPVRDERGRDRRGARRASGHGEVAAVPRARATAHASWRSTATFAEVDER